MAKINWNSTAEDRDIIFIIARRYRRIAEDHGADCNLWEVQMDVLACHLNGTPLDLPNLFGADDFNFIHDVGGIQKHIDRTTGKLLHCFLPRCHAPLKGDAA